MYLKLRITDDVNPRYPRFILKAETFEAILQIPAHQVRPSELPMVQVQSADRNRVIWAPCEPAVDAARSNFQPGTIYVPRPLVASLAATDAGGTYELTRVSASTFAQYGEIEFTNVLTPETEPWASNLKADFIEKTVRYFFSTARIAFKPNTVIDVPVYPNDTDDLGGAGDPGGAGNLSGAGDLDGATDLDGAEVANRAGDVRFLRIKLTQPKKKKRDTGNGPMVPQRNERSGKLNAKFHLVSYTDTETTDTDEPATKGAATPPSKDNRAKDNRANRSGQPRRTIDGTDYRISREPWRFNDVGGHRDVLRSIRLIVELPTRRPDLARQLGVKPPKGILLYGPPGSGKTLIARSISEAGNINFIHRTASGLFSKDVGSGEKNIDELFERAQADRPALIFIDEIDAVAERRDSLQEDHARRLADHLLAKMDGLDSYSGIIVIGATNRLEAIDGAFRRPGRFDREFEVAYPDRQEREEILRLHSAELRLGTDVDLPQIVAETQGYVGADFKGLCLEANGIALRRCLPDDRPIDEIDPEAFEVTQGDFEAAMNSYVPTSLRSFRQEIPVVDWNYHIVGLHKTKRVILDAVQSAVTDAGDLEEVGVSTSTELLLVGRRGSGRKTVVFGLTNLLDLKCLMVDFTSTVFENNGSPETAVHRLMTYARANRPCVLLFPELDAELEDLKHYTLYSRSVSALADMFDLLAHENSVFTIATAISIEGLPQILFRFGRFDQVVTLEPLTGQEQLELLRSRTPSAIPVDSLQELVGRDASAVPGALLDTLRRILRRMVANGWDPHDEKSASEEFSTALLQVLQQGNK